MGRIPIYTSRQPVQRPIVVKPARGAGTAVPEAIGKAARTISAVVTDWANAKAQDTAQRELASGMVNYKSKMSDYVIGVRDNPDYNKDWEEDFNKFEKETRGEIEFTSQKAKQAAEPNFDNYRISYKTELAGVDRQKYQKAGRIQLNTDLDIAEKMRDKGQVKRLLESANLLLSGPARKAEKIKRDRAIEMLQVRDILTLDPKAEIKWSDYSNLDSKDKANLASEMVARKNRLKAERKEQEEIYFEQTNDAFEASFKKNELTLPEVDTSTLPTKEEGGKMYWRKRLTTKAADETNEKASDYIRRQFNLERITSTDIDSRQDELTKSDYDSFKRQYKARETAIINGKYVPSVFVEKSDMFTEELDRLAANGTITAKEAESAKLELPEQLHDKSMKENFTEKQITDYSEFLIGSYLQRESQIKKDASTFWKFINLAPYRAIPELIKSARREKRVEALPTEAEFPTEEVEEEAIEIKDISPENVSHLSDWLKKNNKVVNEKNIRYLYEQLK